MADFKVQLCRNVGSVAPETFMVRRGWDIATFKKKAGAQLNLKVKRVFLSNGSEITGTDEMSANEILYVSAGEEFFRAVPLNSSNASNIPVETFNISVLGTGGVGKSAITLRFIRDTFIHDWDPTIEDAYKKTISVDGKTCVLDVLDTAGQDDFESLRPSWMIGKDGYVFVFSLDQPSSLSELTPFFDLNTQLNEGRTVPIVLCGNKKDLGAAKGASPEAQERLAKSREAGIAKAAELHARYVESSAFTGEGVAEVFMGVVQQARVVASGSGGGAQSHRRGADASSLNGGGKKCVVM